MALSQNGWSAIEDGSSKMLHSWVIPAKNGTLKIKLRRGSAGFILAHFLLWFSETIEDLTGKILDDWGWAYRPVRGQTTGLSNHASGTAFDANALKHSLGRRGTFKKWQYLKMRARLVFYRGCIRLGLDYQNRPDEMHGEIDKDLAACEKVARMLMKTPRGKRLLVANPTQKKVIMS